MAETEKADQFDRLDLHLLRTSPVTMYFKQEVLTKDIDWFVANGYAIYYLDCARWSSETDFHDSMKETLGFPDDYGKNMDAFNDCLRNLALPENGGAVLAFKRFDSFAYKFPMIARTALDIIATRSRVFLLQGRRVLALVQSDDPRFATPPVGACPVVWNPAEWLNRNRGL